jgi:hypothetical protein
MRHRSSRRPIDCGLKPNRAAIRIRPLFPLVALAPYHQRRKGSTLQTPKDVPDADGYSGAVPERWKSWHGRLPARYADYTTTSRGWTLTGAELCTSPPRQPKWYQRLLGRHYGVARLAVRNLESAT